MIVNLLQALYDPRSILPLPSDLDFYKQAKEDIAFFGISSQVYYLLQKQGQLNQTPLFFQKWLKQNYTEALYLNLFVENRMLQILNLFEDQEIQAIPLKGVLFAERYFGHAGARATSDIDILIQLSDLDKAVECVKLLGYKSEEKRIPAHFHWSFSKILPHSPIPLTVELHWDLLKENTSNLRIEEFWQQVKPWKHYRHIKELSEYHTFYMMSLHGWKHNMNSMKYVLDIVQLIHVLQEQLDYSVLFKNAASHGTLKRLVWTLTVVYDHFPHLEGIKALPLQRKKNIHWDYQAIRIPNMVNYRHYLNVIYSQYFIFDSMKHGLHGIGSWVLPSKVELGFELGSNIREEPLWMQYMRLYAQRGYHVLLTLFHRRTEVKRLSHKRY